MPYRGGYNNYDFVISPSFSPFTMQEMLVPFTAYKEAFDKSEEAYTDLKTKADNFAYLSRTLPENSNARQMYENYANELNAQAEDLASNGLTMNNRRALTKLKQRYQGEIGELARLSDIRNKQIAEQRELRIKDPTMLFSRDALNSTLDDYLTNPDLSYSSYSGALLASQVGTAAKSISTRLKDSIETGRLDDFTKTFIEDTGFSSEEIMEAIEHPTQGNPVLSAIVEQAVQTSGIPKWGNESALRDAYNWANTGLWSAVGSNKLHTFEDFENRLIAEEASKMRLAAQSARLKAETEGKSSSASSNDLSINPLPIFTPKDQEDFKDNVKQYSKYFGTTSDGRTILTKEGLDEYNRKTKGSDTITSPTGAVMRVDNSKVNDSPFKTFIDSIGGAEFAKKRQIGNIGNLWNIYKEKEGKTDAIKTTEYEFNPYDSQRKDIKYAIMRAAMDGKLEEADFDRSSNKFKPTGKSIDVDELSSDDYTVSSTRFSPYGSTVLIQKKGEGPKRYTLPPGINPINESNRDKALQRALELQEVLTSGEYRDSSGNMRKLTQEEFENAYSAYKLALQEAYLYHSQLGISNKVKEQEFNPYGY